MTDVYTLEDVSWATGDSTIIEHMSLSIPSGTLVAIVGKNGSGKTTLLALLRRFLHPTNGRISLFDRDLESWSESDLSSHLSFLASEFQDVFPFTVRDFLSLVYQVIRPREKFSDWMEWLNGTIKGLPGETRVLSTLSSGERQRVRLAGAIGKGSNVLLLDEPANHLDIPHRYGFFKELRRLAEEGRTVIVSLHDFDLLKRFCDRYILLDNGRVLMAERVSDSLTIHDLFPDMREEIFT